MLQNFLIHINFSTNAYFNKIILQNANIFIFEKNSPSSSTILEIFVTQKFSTLKIINSSSSKNFFEQTSQNHSHKPLNSKTPPSNSTRSRQLNTNKLNKSNSFKHVSRNKPRKFQSSKTHNSGTPRGTRVGQNLAKCPDAILEPDWD